uniref:Uncharacterized protein n=1 Tax=Dulem virus 233 TaxID=3145710 RepID=A0AAU8AWM5_9VIRU
MAFGFNNNDTIQSWSPSVDYSIASAIDSKYRASRDSRFDSSVLQGLGSSLANVMSPRSASSFIDGALNILSSFLVVNRRK